MDTCSSQNKQFLYNIDDDVIVKPWTYGPDDPRQKLPPVRCSFTIARYSTSGLQFSFDKIDIEDCGVFIVIYDGLEHFHDTEVSVNSFFKNQNITIYQ